MATTTKGLWSPDSSANLNPLSPILANMQQSTDDSIASGIVFNAAGVTGSVSVNTAVIIIASGNIVLPPGNRLLCITTQFVLTTNTAGAGFQGGLTGTGAGLLIHRSNPRDTSSADVQAGVLFVVASGTISTNLWLSRNVGAGTGSIVGARLQVVDFGRVG